MGPSQQRWGTTGSVLKYKYSGLDYREQLNNTPACTASHYGRANGLNTPKEPSICPRHCQLGAGSVASFTRSTVRGFKQKSGELTYSGRKTYTEVRPTMYHGTYPVSGHLGSSQSKVAGKSQNKLFRGQSQVSKMMTGPGQHSWHSSRKYNIRCNMTTARDTDHPSFSFLLV